MKYKVEPTDKDGMFITYSDNCVYGMSYLKRITVNTEDDDKSLYHAEGLDVWPDDKAIANTSALKKAFKLVDSDYERQFNILALDQSPNVQKLLFYVLNKQCQRAGQ